MSDPEENTDLFPDWITLARRADRVSDSLNALRNAVQGRGVHPIGSAELAAAVNDAQATWMEVRAKLIPHGGKGHLISDTYAAAEALEHWERKLNELVQRAAAEGVPDVPGMVEVTHTAAEPGEVIELVETRIKSGLETVAAGLLLLGAGLGTIYYLTRRVR